MAPYPTQQSLIEKLGLGNVVEHWWTTQRELLPADRSPNMQALYQLLADEHQYSL